MGGPALTQIYTKHSSSRSGMRIHNCLFTPPSTSISPSLPMSITLVNEDSRPRKSQSFQSARGRERGRSVLPCQVILAAFAILVFRPDLGLRNPGYPRPTPSRTRYIAGGVFYGPGKYQAEYEAATSNWIPTGETGPVAQLGALCLRLRGQFVRRLAVAQSAGFAASWPTVG